MTTAMTKDFISRVLEYQILKAGGSAIDAAVAVQMVLALVEPQSSGLGGGAFLLHHDGQRVEAYDGRETAPAAATETLFLGPDGKPMPFYDAVVGGRSVGVPGVVRMLELAHAKHGKLAWPRLFERAIMLAYDLTILVDNVTLLGFNKLPQERPHRNISNKA